MPNESTTQMSLVTSALFRNRLAYLLDQQARVVLAETGVGVTHAARAAYASSVVSNVNSFASSTAVMIVGGTNLIGAAVIPNADPNLVDSAATDAAILSQIATFWNALAGINTGN